MSHEDQQIEVGSSRGSWIKSWVGALLVMLLVTLVVVLPRMHERARMATREANLKMLGEAIAAYASENIDGVPVVFSIDPKDYVYLATSNRRGILRGPILAENPDQHPTDGMLMVLDADSHVERRSRADVEAMIAKQ